VAIAASRELLLQAMRWTSTSNLRRLIHAGDRGSHHAPGSHERPSYRAVAGGDRMKQLRAGGLILILGIATIGLILRPSDAGALVPLATDDVVFIGANTSSSLSGIMVYHASDRTTSQLSSYGIMPDVSSDGAKLVVTGGCSPDSTDSCLHVMNSDGSGRTQITFRTVGSNESQYDLHPRWSPDRQWIVFMRETYASDGSAPASVMKVRPDGSELTTLKARPYGGDSTNVASWSPPDANGKFRIVYSVCVCPLEPNPGVRSGERLFIMNEDGSNDHLLTSSDSAYSENEPVWSPDGQRIYFATNQKADGTSGYAGESLAYYSSSDQFTTTNVTRSLLLSERVIDMPRVSADSSTIYFTSRLHYDLNLHIARISASGGTSSERLLNFYTDSDPVPVGNSSSPPSPTTTTTVAPPTTSPPTTTTTAPPPPYQCGDLKFFGARGSGQASDDHGGYGKEIASTLTFLNNLLPARTNLQSQAVDYPAIAVKWWLPSYYVADYQASKDAGVQSLQFDVRQYIRNCPTKPIILAGYSQGADVVGDTFLSLDLDEKAHIAAVIMFGDPKFNPAKSQNKVNQGNYKYWFGVATQPVLGRTTPPPRVIPDTQQQQSRVHSYCTKGDPVCNFNEYNVFTCSGNNTVLECAHLFYIERGYTYEGAKWAVERWKKVR
jgi:cutinase